MPAWTGIPFTASLTSGQQPVPFRGALPSTPEESVGDHGIQSNQKPDWFSVDCWAFLLTLLEAPALGVSAMILACEQLKDWSVRVACHQPGVRARSFGAPLCFGSMTSSRGPH